MSTFKPAEPDYAERVTASFARQPFMATLGARLAQVEPGLVAIELQPQAALTQQVGYLHAGVLASVLDSACGYAAYSLFPAGSEVLSIEFKLNLLAPSVGVRLLAQGRVLRAGRTITVCQGEAWTTAADGSTKLVAAMQATMMRIEPQGAAR